MLIVSQDRDLIINSDNIEVLGIGNPLEDDDGKFKILANTTSDSQYTIAKYDTEERATKVFEEIVNKYLEYASVANAIGDIKQVYTIPKVYLMPEK